MRIRIYIGTDRIVAAVVVTLELCLGKIFYMEEVCTTFQNTSKFKFLDILLWNKRVIRCLQYLKIYHNLSENIFKDKQQLKNVDENVSLHCPRVLSNHLNLNVCVYFEYLHIKRNRYKCGTANRRRHMRYFLHIETLMLSFTLLLLFFPLVYRCSYLSFMNGIMLFCLSNFILHDGPEK